LTSLVSIVALVIAPVVLARLIGPGEQAAIASIFAIPLDPPLPRGVQEEEPAPWRLEHLKPRQERTVPGRGRNAVPALDAGHSGC
jgi:hypothetical protein